MCRSRTELRYGGVNGGQRLWGNDRHVITGETRGSHANRAAYYAAMHVSQANIGEVAPVMALLSAQFAEHAIAPSDAELTEAVRVLLSERERGMVLLATESTAAIGVAVLAFTWTLEHAGQVAWLDELYVVPERRGQGVGGALLERAIPWRRQGRMSSPRTRSRLRTWAGREALPAGGVRAAAAKALVAFVAGLRCNACWMRSS